MTLRDVIVLRHRAPRFPHPRAFSFGEHNDEKVYCLGSAAQHLYRADEALRLSSWGLRRLQQRNIACGLPGLPFLYVMLTSFDVTTRP